MKKINEKIDRRNVKTMLIVTVHVLVPGDLICFIRSSVSITLSMVMRMDFNQM